MFDEEMTKHSNALANTLIRFLKKNKINFTEGTDDFVGDEYITINIPFPGENAETIEITSEYCFEHVYFSVYFLSQSETEQLIEKARELCAELNEGDPQIEYTVEGNEYGGIFIRVNMVYIEDEAVSFAPAYYELMKKMAESIDKSFLRFEAIGYPFVKNCPFIHLANNKKVQDGKLITVKCFDIKQELISFGRSNGVAFRNPHSVYSSVITNGKSEYSKKIEFHIWENEVKEGEEVRINFLTHLKPEGQLPSSKIKKLCEELSEPDKSIEFNCDHYQEYGRIGVWGDLNVVADSNIEKVFVPFMEYAEKMASVTDRAVLQFKALKKRKASKRKDQGEKPTDKVVDPPKKKETIFVIKQPKPAKLPNVKLEMPGKVYWKKIYYHCPHCGMDISGPEDCFEEGCPVCGSPVNKYLREYYYTYSLNSDEVVCYNTETLDILHTSIDTYEPSDDEYEALSIGKSTYDTFIFEYLGFLRDREQKKIAEKRVYDFSSSNADYSDIKDAIERDPASLKKYISSLISVESDVYALEQRVIELNIAESKVNEAAEQKEALASARFPSLLEKLSCLEAERDFFVGDTTPYDSHYYAVKKPQEPTPPKEPVYETPGFFNKRRIMEENEAKKREYDTLQKKYDQDLAVFHDEMSRYENAKAEYIKAQQEQNAREKEKLEDQVKEVERVIDAIKDNQAHPANVEIAAALVAEEKAQAEDALTKMYQARRDMYSTGVVYEKYRNMVALSSFFEYLDSGRCDELRGTAGAYNIYENEIRQNLIITQLSDVLRSLDRIINNQYALYSQIAKANRSLEELNESLNDAVSEVKSLRITSDSIDKNVKQTAISSAIAAQNSTVSAYYAERTAFYAEKNAELTNALGFLIALK